MPNPTPALAAPHSTPAMASRDVVLALGSNIDPEHHLPAAARALAAALPLRAVSTVYESAPVGAPGTPRFLNAALRVAWQGTPHRLRDGVTRVVEEKLGRVRTGDPNAPRTIDIDVVLVRGMVLEDPRGRLWLPDPELSRRQHLAIPVAEVAGDWAHPILGRTLRDIAGDVGRSELRARPEVALAPGDAGNDRP